MNRSYFALFVALLIHTLLLLLFWLLGIISPLSENKKPKENKIKVSLKEMPKKSEPTENLQETPQKPLDIAPPMPNGTQLKKIVEPIKREPIKYEPKKAQEHNSMEKKPLDSQKANIESSNLSKLPKAEPLTQKEPYITLPKEDKKSKSESSDWMYEDRSEEETKKEVSKQKSGGSINSDLKELYGDEFGKFTPGQQKYLLDNQEIMRRITQEVLNRVAQVNLKRDLNINKTNIVEFYLHPNGDMTDFKFLKNSGHYILDDTTKETIEYAYSRYPRPSEKILIRYNVFYNLAKY